MSPDRPRLLMMFIYFFIFLSQSTAVALEASLFDIELLSDYRKTTDILRSTFKYPGVSGLSPEPFTTFAISAQGHELTIYSDDNNKVSKIKISGNTPLDKLNFLGSINTGTSASNLELQAGLPAVPQTKSDGSRSYIFGNSNFAVETKSGKVSAISIYVTNSKKIAPDMLKNYCTFRHPVWQQGDFFYTQLNLEIKGQIKSVVAQLNTGSKKSTMSHALCRKYNCKATEPQLAVLKFGLENHFKRREYLVVDSPKVLGRSFDISLGNDFLFSQPFFLNLQHDYICRPGIPLQQIASSLQMGKLSAKRDDESFLVPIKLLLLKQTVVRLDSGNRDMALDQKSIKYLQLEKLPMTYFPTSGGSLGTYTGKIKFSIGNSLNEAERFYVSPLARYQKIGSKQMTGLIWGFDLKNQTIYVKN